MILLLILFVAVIAVLWRLGGWEKAKWSGYRDVLVPILMGIVIGLRLPAPLLWKVIIGVLSIGSFQIIRMGYGNWDPEHDDKPSWLAKITHDRNGWWIRLLYGVIVALVASIPLTVYNIINGNIVKSLLSLAAYIVICGVVNFLVSRLKLKDTWAELLVGASFATRIFIV